MACAIGFALTLVYVAFDAPGELDGMVEDSPWSCWVPLFYPFLLFPIVVRSFVAIDIDYTGMEHFAAGFCLMFLCIGTSLKCFYTI
jgi:hypothetical protein